MKGFAFCFPRFIKTHLTKNVKNMQEEIWIDVIGYENLYQISNLGNVKSLSKRIKRNIKIMENDIDYERAEYEWEYVRTCEYY